MIFWIGLCFATLASGLISDNGKEKPDFENIFIEYSHQIELDSKSMAEIRMLYYPSKTHYSTVLVDYGTLSACGIENSQKLRMPSQNYGEHILYSLPYKRDDFVGDTIYINFYDVNDKLIDKIKIAVICDEVNNVCILSEYK